MTEKPNWGELSADEVRRVATLENRVREWASNKERGIGEVDRRARIIGGLLGWELNREDEIMSIVEGVKKIEWNDSPSDNVVTFLEVLAEADMNVDVVGEVGKRAVGDRKMEDKALLKKLEKAGIKFGADAGCLKLAIYVLRKLNDAGNISTDQLEKLANNFALRVYYWEQKRVGKKPADVLGEGHSKWDPSPMSTDYLSDFVANILEYGANL